MYRVDAVTWRGLIGIDLNVRPASYAASAEARSGAYQLQGTYALKVLRPDFASDSDFRRRFAREISAARAVHSPFVNAVTDADPDAPTPWLASYFIPGPPLNTTRSAPSSMKRRRLRAGGNSAAASTSTGMFAA